MHFPHELRTTEQAHPALLLHFQIEEKDRLQLSGRCLGLPAAEAANSTFIWHKLLIQIYSISANQTGNNAPIRRRWDENTRIQTPSDQPPSVAAAERRSQPALRQSELPMLDRSEGDRPVQGAASALQLLGLRKSAARRRAELSDPAGTAVPVWEGV